MGVVVPRRRRVAVFNVAARRDDDDRHYHERNFIALRVRLFVTRRRGAPRKQECQRKRQEAVGAHSCGLYRGDDVNADPFSGSGMSFGLAGFETLCFPFWFPLWCRAGCAGLSLGGRIDFLAALRSSSTALSQVLNRRTGIFPGPAESLRTRERPPFSNESQISSRAARRFESWMNRLESCHRVLLSFFCRGSEMSSRHK